MLPLASSTIDDLESIVGPIGPVFEAAKVSPPTTTTRTAQADRSTTSRAKICTPLNSDYDETASTGTSARSRDTARPGHQGMASKDFSEENRKARDATPDIPAAVDPAEDRNVSDRSCRLYLWPSTYDPEAFGEGWIDEIKRVTRGDAEEVSGSFIWALDLRHCKRADRLRYSPTCADRVML